MKPPADVMETKVNTASPSSMQTRGPSRSPFTLQELQDLAEKQRQQIYLNSQELIAKQQKLMELQQYGFRNRPRNSTSSMSSQQEQDSYAAKLRETYQNHLERLREMQIVQDETDAQRFSNIELTFELDRVREMFLAKQRELASAVAKVENLTKQLEERKSGVTTWNITPEKMRRRRKIQAAREELDKLRNEMTVRNELNSQQSHQLRMQKEILREKQRELNDLDAQIHLLGKQLKQYQTKGPQKDNYSYKPLNGDSAYRGNFAPSILYDTLQRKRGGSRPMTPLGLGQYQQQYSQAPPSPKLPDLNGNVYQQAGLPRNGMSPKATLVADVAGRRKVENGSVKRGSPLPFTRRGNLYVAPDGREFDRPPTWDDYVDIEKLQPDSSRVFSPTFSTQSEASTSSSGSGHTSSSPNLPQGRTDVKPVLQVNGLESAHSRGLDSPHGRGFDLGHGRGLDSPHGRGLDSPHGRGLDSPHGRDGSPKGHGPTFRDAPLSGHTPKKDLFAARSSDSLKPIANGSSLSPSSSVSSLSSLSSNMTNEDSRPNFPTSKEGASHVAPYASYVTRSDKPASMPQGYLSASKHGQDVWNDATEFRTVQRTPSPGVSVTVTYRDSSLSTSVDVITSRSMKFVDSRKSSAREIINFSYLQKAVELPESFDAKGSSVVDDLQIAARSSSPSVWKPPVAQKPQVAPKPTRTPPPPPADKETGTSSVAEVNANLAINDQGSADLDAVENSTEKKSVKDLVEKFAQEQTPVTSALTDKRNEGAQDMYSSGNIDNAQGFDATDNVAMTQLAKEFPPPPPYIPKIPDHDPPPYSEIENYELSSFADIDMISATQNDLLPFLINASRSQYISDSQETMYDSDSSSQISDNDKIVVPVVISVPPEKMPPPALVRQGQERRPKRNVQLDPHALLLDASLEGELAIVKQIVGKVPDPSVPNAEGITALHNAVCGNHKEVVKFLVDIGCDINSADNNGWTPLHCAAFYNDTDLCTFLVEHGASVYATTYSDCQTPSQKCSRLEDNYDQCFQYLHDSKDHVGKLNDGRIYALYDYIAESEDELSFSSGEQLTVLRRGDPVEKEWWWAENSKKQTGYIPFNLTGLFPRVAAEV